MPGRCKLIMLTGIAFLTVLGCGGNPSALGVNRADMNLAVSPGDNFYEYANGTWLKTQSIPEGRSRWGALHEVNAKTREQMKGLVKYILEKEWPVGSDEDKIKIFYLSGMDTAAIETSYLSPIQPLLDEIEAIKTRRDFYRMTAKLHALEIQPFFYFFSGQDEKHPSEVIPQLYQASLALTDYTRDDDRSKTIQKAYLDYIKIVFEHLGYGTIEAEAIAIQIFNLEKTLASIYMGRRDLRDPRKVYNPYAMNDLPEVMPHFEWPAYFREIGFNYVGAINISQPRYFEQLDRVLKDLPLAHLRHYLTWSLLSELAPYLPKPLAEAYFHFNSTVLRGIEKKRPRHEQVLQVLNEYLGEPLGKVYVNAYFEPQSKERLLEMVEYIKSTFQARIEQTMWMSDETKTTALEKLQRLVVKVGYPEEWTDYSSLEVSSDSYVQNRLKAGAFSFHRDLAQIGSPVNRTAWEMLPQTGNAYYHPVMNEIAFPAAFLQPPIYAAQADAAYNFGSVGVAMAHEMSHGFDDQGRHSDAEGVLRDWWTREDEVQFEAITQPLVAYYGGFEVLEGHFVDGRLTLGENIADLGGLTIAFEALQDYMAATGDCQEIEGFSPEQRFFLAYAQSKHELHRKESLIRRLKTNVHPPCEVRVLGPLPHLNAFYEAFDVSPSDSMYIPPAERIAVW